MLKAIQEYIRAHEPEGLALWEALVRAESWSGDPAGVAACADILEDRLAADGLAVTRHCFEKAGPTLAAVTREGDGAVVFMGHMDTVHRPGSFGPDCFRQEGGLTYGPGVHDCKGGVAAAVLAAEALLACGYDARPLRLVFSGDEEVGHSLSEGAGADLFTRAARGAAAAFNCESGLMNGDVISRRKGGLAAAITVRGIAAHAGREPEKGASAIKEAARKILAIEALSDPEDVTFNCGVVSGGTGSGTVPAECRIEVGVRFRTNAGRDRALGQLQAITEACADSRVTADLQVLTGFPAMEEVPGSRDLKEIWRRACAALGFPEPAFQATGGCSDAAFVTSAGVPALCGVGVRGADNHTPRERAATASLAEQAMKLAAAAVLLK